MKAIDILYDVEDAQELEYFCRGELDEWLDNVDSKLNTEWTRHFRSRGMSKNDLKSVVSTRAASRALEFIRERGSDLDALVPRDMSTVTYVLWHVSIDSVLKSVRREFGI